MPTAGLKVSGSEGTLMTAAQKHCIKLTSAQKSRFGGGHGEMNTGGVAGG